jgi:Protein of unknown function (DUF3237)
MHSTLETEFLLEMRVQLELPHDCGNSPNGYRTIHIVKSGTVAGPRIRGRIVPYSGGDWALTRPDGSAHLDVRLCIETHDSALIYLTSIGRMVIGNLDDVAYAMDFNKPDDPAGAHRYYFRTSYTFETGDPRYAWLNHIVTAVKGRTGDGGVIYEMFALK